MGAERGRVLVEHGLVGRRVDAERAHGSLIVDGDVAVLPDDLRELAVDDLTRAAADLRHLVGADGEGAEDQVPGHGGANGTGPAWIPISYVRCRRRCVYQTLAAGVPVTLSHGVSR